MQHIIDILSDVGFWKIAAPIAFAFAAWILNERKKLLGGVQTQRGTLY